MVKIASYIETKCRIFSFRKFQNIRCMVFPISAKFKNKNKKTQQKHIKKQNKQQESCLVLSKWLPLALKIYLLELLMRKYAIDGGQRKWWLCICRSVRQVNRRRLVRWLPTAFCRVENVNLSRGNMHIINISEEDLNWMAWQNFLNI